jgi:integrase
MRFTVTWIEKLKPAKTRRDFTETNRPGFMLRIEPTGTKKFYYRYQRAAKRIPLELGTYPETSLDAAHRRYERAREIFDSGEDPATVFNAEREAASAAGTVDELLAEWYARYALKKRRRPEAAKGLLDANIPASFRKWKAKDITRRQCVTLIDGIADRSEAVAKDVYALLRQIFAFGVERDLIPASPLVALKPPGGREEPRTRVLSDSEIATVWTKLADCQMSERIRLALKFLLLTAQRRGETSLARWSDIDFAAKVWTIPAEHAKTRNSQPGAHLVPLSAPAISILDQLKKLQDDDKQDSELIFPTAHSKVKAGAPMTERAITRAVRENEDKFAIPHFTPHDFRRTARTTMARLGVPDTVAELVLNHKLRGMVAVYNKYGYLDEKRQALELWASHVESVLAAHERQAAR